MSELKCAAVVALTLTNPLAATVLSWICAVAPEPVFPPKAFATAGSPISASTVLNSTFCDCHPIVLNASVTATPVPPEVTAFTTVASIVAVFSASTSTCPLVPVVLMPLSVIVALAPLSTVLVAISPLAAKDVPLPKSPAPPAESASLVRLAVKVAFSSAFTLTSPPLAVSVVWSMFAVAPPRTSFKDTAPDTPIALPLTNGFVFDAVADEASAVVALIEAPSVADTVTPPPPAMVFAPVYVLL
jgi:hypothetical protein